MLFTQVMLAAPEGTQLLAVPHTDRVQHLRAGASAASGASPPRRPRLELERSAEGEPLSYPS